jgi:hypothetical protein
MMCDVFVDFGLKLDLLVVLGRDLKDFVQVRDMLVN